jgi:hypothetical protein
MHVARVENMLVKIITTVFIGLALTLAIQASSPAGDEEGIVARINIEKKPNGMIGIRPTCRVMRSTVVDYILTLDKHGGQGNSLSRQSGKASLKSNQETTLCYVAINVSPGSKCLVNLKISQQGRVLSEKNIELKGSEIDKII